MRAAEFVPGKVQKIDEFLPVLGAIGGALGRGALTAGGALGRGIGSLGGAALGAAGDIVGGAAQGIGSAVGGVAKGVGNAVGGISQGVQSATGTTTQQTSSDKTVGAVTPIKPGTMLQIPGMGKVKVVSATPTTITLDTSRIQ
jgi:hypothetical protein